MKTPRNLVYEIRDSAVKSLGLKVSPSATLSFRRYCDISYPPKIQSSDALHRFAASSKLAENLFSSFLHRIHQFNMRVLIIVFPKEPQFVSCTTKVQ